ADRIFLVMDYVDGASVHRIAKTYRAAQRVVPIPVTLRVILDVLQGLHAAHELTDTDGAALKLVHRDVSPHNLLVGLDGVTRITDFGVAFAAYRLAVSTKDGRVKGKIPYMSPEQLRSETIDRRSDIYSTAIVLWELLTGERLFHGDNEGA